LLMTSWGRMFSCMRMYFGQFPVETVIVGYGSEAIGG
jgi:hypothetical protein